MGIRGLVWRGPWIVGVCVAIALIGPGLAGAGEKLVVWMGNLLATDDAPWNILMTVAVLYSIPQVIFYYCFRRHLVRGLVTGAVTGV